jgi:uncharacterized membrane protein
VPLAVFGGLHFFGPQFVASLVPAYMPWRTFWVWAVGAGLVAASLSIATGVATRWAGLLFGLMMLSFVAMIHLPGAIRLGNDRVVWTIVFRESSFGGAGLIIAGMATDAWRRGEGSRLVLVGQILVTAAILVFGVEHFIWATGLPGVPLNKELPAWLPARFVVDWLTGAALLAAAACVVVRRHARAAVTVLGGWLLVMMVVVYVPVLIAGLSSPEIGVELTGINYFADTLLFTGAVLWLAKSLPRSDGAAP